MENDPRIYVRRSGRMYRITIQRNTVWVERQTPRAFAGNRPMKTDPDDLWDGSAWNLDILDVAIDRYERDEEE